MITASVIFWLNIFFSKYILTLFMLLPVIFYYLMALINQYSTKHLLIIHKILAVAFVVLPPLLTLTAITTDDWQAVSAGLSNSSSDSGVTAASTPSPPVTYLTNDTLFFSSFFHDTTNFIVALFSLTSLLFATALAASLLVLLVNAAKQVLFARSIHNLASSIESYDGAAIITSDAISMPFSTHFLEKRVYLPSGLTPEQRQVVLQHELKQFHCRHHHWQIVDAVLTYLYWFNPFSHIMRRVGDKYREMECDDLTTKTVDRFLYGKTLVTMAQAVSLSRCGTWLGHAWINKNTLQQRIHNLLGGKQPVSYRRFKLGGLILCTAALSGCLIGDLVNQNELEQQVVAKMDGIIAAQRASGNYLEYEEIPLPLIDMLVLMQDKRFFSHDGVDNLAMARAVYKHLDRKHSGGGSTLTMQATTNFVIGTDASIRKDAPFKYKSLQMRIAKIIENHYSKEEILSVYLSGIYWGHNNYGLKQAAEFYLDTSVSNLSKEQSALLIQMIPAPTILNPINRPHNAQNRASTLLEHYATTRLKSPDNI